MAKRIIGVAKYFTIEMGFWGIETASEKYYPINMPEQLKSDNGQVTCSIEVLEDIMTTVSWGIPCKVISFLTISEVED